MKRLAAFAALSIVAACAGEEAEAPATTPVATTPPPSPTSAPTATPPAAGCTGAACDPPPPAPIGPLEVRFLGVQGFLVEVGDEALLTSPLFTRPNGLQVTTGLPVSSDPSLVAKNIPASSLARVRAVLSGHAHYDHLLDTPAVLQRAPSATLFSNVSTRNILAAWAPDRAAACSGTPAQASPIARSRIVAMDDAAKSRVDWHGCLDKKPASAPVDGTWVDVPGANMRVLAVCSEHADQIGPVHYGEGDVAEEKCTPPKNMNEWKEGLTLGFLVDFLEPKTRRPVYRVYYEDAPAWSDKGQVPAAILAEKRIDLALACVGSYQNVPGAPGNTLATMRPRFAIGGHWEDFLRALDQPIQPIPFLDTSDWDTKALAAMPRAGEEARMLRNDQPLAERVLRAQPNDTFEIR
ncbi:MAG: hypothetical protein JST00_30380 [Deltaproteobacteria bacterium]|nr:hypothetical protein [Deltaproteobacteria bacterium]